MSTVRRSLPPVRAKRSAMKFPPQGYRTEQFREQYLLWSSWHQGDENKPVWWCRIRGTSHTYWAKTPEAALKLALADNRGGKE